ncbi:DUF1572 family protein [Flavobacteriaceae bacterium TP-CH-4]|uniref:DUF1572 family protein n=1 Tax=Pelagihabitans pacificus TaxID=2696054 RepID=A0A967AXR2_9FLAO|nr:DUF1572 family protein [Pelagihabitans pacificus]NHF61250.1 DUF1572 family protein [Pelagihabitans pacificus]
MLQSSDYLRSVFFEFRRYKTLGDKTFEQLSEEDVHWKYRETDNSVALIVKHLVGNMKSRWTHFLTQDGEKPWRNRETEFEGAYASKSELINAWEEGWKCLFDALASVNDRNFDTTIRIRNEEHTIIEAVNRQLAHYASHIGQIVLLGKMIKGIDWISLSIPKGGSEAFNKEMFGS